MSLVQCGREYRYALSLIGSIKCYLPISEHFPKNGVDSSPLIHAHCISANSVSVQCRSLTPLIMNNFFLMETFTYSMHAFKIVPSDCISSGVVSPTLCGQHSDCTKMRLLCFLCGFSCLLLMVVLPPVGLLLLLLLRMNNKEECDDSDYGYHDPDHHTSCHPSMYIILPFSFLLTVLCCSPNPITLPVIKPSFTYHIVKLKQGGGCY